MKSRIVCLSLVVPLVLLLSSVQAERRHVIEIYNKNHHVTKNVSPSTDPPSTLDSSASNKRTSRNSRHIPTEVSTQDNEVSSSKESRTKVSQNSHDSRIKGLKTGIDYVHEPESTYTLSRRKSKSLKRKQQQQQQQQYQAVPQAHHQEQQQQQQQQQISQSPHRFQHQYHPDLQKIQPHQQEQQQQQQREQQQQAQQQQQQQAQQQQQQQQAQQQQQQQQQSLRTQSNKQAGVTNKFRDYIATPSFQQEPKTPLPIRVLSVPTGTSQRSSNSQSGRIALGSSPKDTIIEAPLYNFVSGGQLQLQPNVQVHYSDYRHRQALPEPNYASHVQYLPEVQNPHVPFPAPVMNVPQMHQISAVASPMIVSQQHVPMVHQPMHQLPLVQHHLSYHQQSHLVPEPEAPKQAGHEGGAPLTEEELHAEIMEHFYNDEFFKGFFDTGPPALSMLPTPPTPPAPAQPVHQQDSLQVMEQQSGYNSNPHNQAPYGFVQNSGFKMAAPTLYNVQTDPRINYVQAQPILAIPKTVYGVNAAYPQSSVAYQAPFPAVRYMDELKAAYSNNIEKSVNVSSSSSSSTGERTKNPESSSATSSEKKEFPITIQKKMLGQENLHGKPWGEKTVISYEDPKDPNNFVQVSEMRMSVNRPLDPESASTHLNELMNTFGSGPHNQANRSFDDDASAAAAAAKK